MVDLITFAYGLPADRVQGGPAWLDSDRFDIAAKAPQGTTRANLTLMLQALLADRFKLVVHQDTKPLNAYSLTVGKAKPKLKEASGSGAPDCENKNPAARPSDQPYTEFACRNITMEAFANVLRLWGFAGGLQNVPVADSTGLKGAWDFDIKWSNRAQIALGADSDAVSLLDAVDKQLGLKLEIQKMPLPVLIVDSVNEKPTDNPPDVAAKLPPPPPAEFEVADIRPSLPGVQEDGRFQNGRLEAHGIPLKELIMAAWDINSNALIANAPKFTETARFDIIAKASTDPKLAAEIDDPTLLLMVRALLVDRFKLAAHMEDRPVSAYVLTANKPRLQKADPANRTGCHEGPGADGKDPRIGNISLNRLMTCQNMTMKQFAEQLPTRVPGYVQTQVVDSTGLEGPWDFTFAFSGVNVLNAAKVANPGAASDPNGAISLQDALNKQLGLKLDMQKRDMPVLVIDHVEEKPTEN